MHSAHAVNNYCNTFSWLFGKLMGDNYAGSLTGYRNSHRGVGYQRVGQISEVTNPVRNLFPETSQKTVVSSKKQLPRRQQSRNFPICKKHWPLLSPHTILWQCYCGRRQQQCDWEVQDKTPACLGHRKLPEVIKQGAATVHIPKTLYYDGCNS